MGAANFHQRDVRKAFGRALVRDAELLQLTLRGVAQCLDGDQVNALTERERAQLVKALEELRMAQKRLHIVGKHVVTRRTQ